MFSAKKELKLATFGRCFVPKSLAFLLLLTCSMVNVNAATIRKDVSVSIPKYQVPMSTLEGYAKAKLLRHLRSNLINVEWVGLDFVSKEHKDVLRSWFFYDFSKKFNVYGLILRRTQKTENAFIFQFEFEKPEKKRVIIDRKSLRNIVSSLGVTKQRREFTLIMDIAISYPTVFPDSYIEDFWTSHFPNASYFAVFRKKVKSANAIEFIAKAIPSAAMPTDIIDTLRLFDLAPFNQNVCWHLSNSIQTELSALKSIIASHCAATGKAMTLSRDVIKPDMAKGYISSDFLIGDTVRHKRGIEVDLLSEKFQFRLEKKPTLFALLALPKAYHGNQEIFFRENIGVTDDFECQNETIYFNTEFGVDQMTRSSVAAFAHFLFQNEFVALYSLLVKRQLQLGLKANGKEINCKIDQAPTLADTESQLESKYGNF